MGNFESNENFGELTNLDGSYIGKLSQKTKIFPKFISKNDRT